MDADDRRAVLRSVRKNLFGRIRLLVGFLLGLGLCVLGLFQADLTVIAGGAIIGSTAVGAAVVEALLVERPLRRRGETGER